MARTQPAHPSDRAAPRRRTLAALTLAVLIVHLYLLSDGWPVTPETGPAGAASIATRPTDIEQGGDSATATAAAPTAPPVITASRVRWIVPRPPEPEPVAPPPPPPPKVVKAPPPPPPPPVEAPPPEVVAEAPPIPLETEPVEVAAPADSEQPLLAAADEPDPAPEAPPPLDAVTAPPPPLQTASPGAPTTPNATPPGQPPVVQTPDGMPLARQDLPPAALPPSAKLMYDVSGRVKGINYNASGSLDWQNDGTRYQAHMVVRALFVGSREQTSVGQIDPTGLIPERFGDKSRSERAAHFDGPQQRIRFSNNAPDAPWLAGGQDRLSVFLQLAALLQARPDAYPTGTVLNLQVAGPGDAEIWRFEVGPEETLALPAGDIRARRVTRVPRKPFDVQTELWLAPSLNHLPVRLRITQHNGDLVEQSLRYMP